MIKTLYLDVETSGLNPIKSALLQVACIIDIDGEIKEKRSWYIRPFEDDEIDDKALEINRLTREQIAAFPLPWEFHREFIDMLAKHVDKFDRTDKFYTAGYNVRFDVDFLSSFFKKIGDDYYGSWFNGRLVDPYPLFQWRDWVGGIKLPNYRLGTVCEKFDIKFAGEAHDAMIDIQATRDLILIMRNK